MFNKMINRLNLPRYVEVILGILMIIGLMSRYATHAQPEGKSLLAYVISYEPLMFVTTIILFLVAARLIAGKPKDYSNFFYKLLMRLAGMRNMATRKMK